MDERAEGPPPVEIPVQTLCAKLNLTLLSPGDESIRFESGEINRPGLQFTGYYEHFAAERLQLLGTADMHYLYNLPEAEMEARLSRFMGFRPPCVLCARGMQPPEILLRCAAAQRVPVLLSRQKTGDISHRAQEYLEFMLAPSILKHGVMLDVFGVGLLLIGESGVGKSEIALELIRAGHRLVADDVVELRRLSDGLIHGSAPELTRCLMEVRGVGIIDVRYLYGVGAVTTQKEIDMVVRLEFWNESKAYERLGLEGHMMDILGVPVPCTELPVSPGRNMAVVIEVAARNNRMKRLGYDAAADFADKAKQGLSDYGRK